jgi:hypothetical protein
MNPVRITAALMATVVSMGAAGCGEAYDASVPESCSYGEWQDPVFFDTRTRDLVFVVDGEELLEAVRPRLRALVEQMVTGDWDGDDVQDRFAFPRLRVAVTSPAAARGLLHQVAADRIETGYGWFADPVSYQGTIDDKT